MKKYIESKVKYQKTDENGKDKKVTELYLVDAVSLTEAESRIYQELEGLNVDVVSGKKSNYTDLFFYPDADKWYKIKVQYVSVDEEKGKEKKVTNYMLVQANDIEQAKTRIDESLSGMTVDYDIVGVNETNIIDVFIYAEN